VKGTCDLLLELWDPPYLGTQIDHWGPNVKNVKLRQNGSRRDQVPYFCNFGTLSIFVRTV